MILKYNYNRYIIAPEPFKRLSLNKTPVFNLRNKKTKRECKENHRKKYFKTKIFVSTKLPDPIHETVFPKLAFIAIRCFRPNGNPVNKPPFNKSSCTFLI